MESIRSPGTVRRATQARCSGAILVIEDDRELRELLELVLKEDGHRLATAADGPAALGLLVDGSFQPDLILADYNLPNGMDGLLVSTKIRETLHRQIPVIVLTGDISTDTLRRIASQDCVQLSKPVKAADVMQAIQRLLSIPQPALRPPLGRRFDTVKPPDAPVIFVVDDDSHVREGIRSLLEANGRTVEDFATCEAFLEAYDRDREGCLLVDAYLPGMTGHELLQRLHDGGYRLPAIMITGNSDVSMALAAMKAGATDSSRSPLAAASCSPAWNVLWSSRGTRPRCLRGERLRPSGPVSSLRGQRQIMEINLAGHPQQEYRSRPEPQPAHRGEPSGFDHEKDGCQIASSLSPVGARCHLGLA